LAYWKATIIQLKERAAVARQQVLDQVEAAKQLKGQLVDAATKDVQGTITNGQAQLRASVANTKAKVEQAVSPSAVAAEISPAHVAESDLARPKEE
jgi:hypothetical protein